MKPLSRASAPAKIILFGEHFVVYDRPAVVMAIERRAYVTAKPRADNRIIVVKSREMGASGAFTPSGEYQPIEGGLEFEPKFKPIYIITKRILSLSGEETLGLEIEVDSSIPIAAGLGSSAAVAVASASAISSLLEMRLSRDEIFRLAFEAERFVHVNPSGVDPAVSTYGGILLYRRGEGIRRLDVEAEIPIIVGDTGVKRVTGEMVSRVSDLLMRYPTVVESIMDAGENIAKLGVEALKSGDMRTLGELMNMNHALLCALGVSNDMIERLISAARRAGALGAKLTGAGGGGCIIALPEKSNVQGITEAIRNAGGEVFVTAKAFEGVRIEE
ncbi:mevalonate kinase [Candidatus Bathyarchaeota archaeon]|nr:mevalonate kinase [Candidatus Bathyarchaeota archaeon]